MDSIQNSNKYAMILALAEKNTSKLEEKIVRQKNFSQVL